MGGIGLREKIAGLFDKTVLEKKRGRRTIKGVEPEGA